MGIMMRLAGFTKAMTFTVRFSGDDRQVGVEVTPVDSSVPGPEYIRLWSLYHAKVIYNLGYPNNMGAVMGVASIAKIVESEIERDTNCFKRSNFDDVVEYQLGLPNGGNQFTGEMYAKGGIDRRLQTHFPMRGTQQQAVYSALAMMQYAIGKNADDPRALDVLTETGRGMVALYETSLGVGVASVLQVPTFAYMKAIGLGDDSAL